MSDTNRSRSRPTPEEWEGIGRAVFEQTGVGVAQIDSESGAFVRVNEKCAELMGYSVAELAQLSFQELTHPDDPADDLGGMVGGPASERRFCRKDGTIVWGRVTVSPTGTIGTEAGSHLAVIEDLTDHRTTEQAFHDSEDRLRETQRMARLGTWYWDVGSGDVEWSEEVYRIFRLSPEEFKPHIESILALSPWPGDRDRDKEVIARAMEGHKQGSYEQRFLRPDGTVGYYRSTFEGIYDNQGVVTAMRGIVQDVTEYEQAVRDAREARDFAESLIQTANTIVVVLDVEGNIQTFNSAAEKITGYRFDELREHNWFEVLVPRHRYPEVWQEFERLTAGGIPAEFENPILTKSGEERHIVWKNSELFHDGQVAGTVSFGMDITDRMRAEAALRSTEERYRLAQRLSGVGTWEWNMAEDTLFWSDEVLSMFGLERSGFGSAYEQVASRIHPDDLERWQENVRACIEDGNEHNIEFRIVWPDGSVHWIAAFGDAEREEDGKARRMVGVVMDITKRKQIEEALRESEARLRTVVQTMPVLVDAFDSQQNIIVWNQECERVTGYTAAEIVGNANALELLYPDRQYRDGVMEAIRGQDGDFRNMEFTLTAKSGEPRTVLWSNLSTSYPIDGWATWAVGLDITESKLAQREREELITRLEAQNAELERFTYTVSHDLKSPLITIKGYIGLLSEDLQSTGGETVQSDLQRISNAADKMSVLLEDLLELSRIGRLINPPEDVPLDELIDETLSLLSGRLDNRQVEIVVQPDLPVLHGDRTRLLEVVQNLIDNAVKYMGEQPRPRIEIGARPDEDEVVCYVRDNGIGIDPRFQEKVFGLFDQLDPSAEGTGIGLALVKRIVEVHGGRIWVESEGEGQGATFWFALPKMPTIDSEDVSTSVER